MPKKTEKCKHRLCKCPARRSDGFCSESCKLAKTKGTTGCRCGHVLCKGKVM